MSDIFALEDELKKNYALERIVEARIGKGHVYESSCHKPGEKYVKKGNLRIYFEKGANLDIKGIYKKRSIIEKAANEIPFAIKSALATAAFYYLFLR